MMILKVYLENAEIDLVRVGRKMQEVDERRAFGDEKYTILFMFE